jgi:hypothetical protein
MVKRTKGAILIGLISLVLPALLFAVGTQEAEDAAVTMPEISASEFDGVEDSSDLKTWTGKQLNLTVWYNDRTFSEDSEVIRDVIWPEITRVTGITFDAEASFANSEQTPQQKLALLAAADDFPHLLYRYRETEEDFIQLGRLGKIYDLTDLHDEKLPNVVEQFYTDPIMRETYLGDLAMELMGGRLYFVRMSIGKAIYKNDFGNLLTLEKMAQRAGAPSVDNFTWWAGNPTGIDIPIYVRQDILDMLYPDNYSEEELKRIYMNGGEFTMDQMYDIPIVTLDDYFEFLRKIKELDLQVNGRDVIPTYAQPGAATADSWEVLKVTTGALMGFNGGMRGPDYFTYFNRQSDEMRYMFAEPWFKEALLKWNRAVREGLVGKEAFVQDSAAFNADRDTGIYAVTGFWNKPDQKVLDAAGTGFTYRKVFLGLNKNYDKFLFTESDALSWGTQNWAIFKTVPEEDLDQVLRFFNYMASDAGQKLTLWGPRSAGLFTERPDGTRRYNDTGVEDAMLNESRTLKDGWNYNLMQRSGESKRVGWPPYPSNQANLYHPKLQYPYTRTPEGYASAMGPGRYPEGRLRTLPSGGWSASDSIFRYQAIPEIADFVKSRKAFEDQLIRCFVPDSDEQFEREYQKLLDIAREIGLTQETLQKVDAEFKRRNAPYLHLY